MKKLISISIIIFILFAFTSTAKAVSIWAASPPGEKPTKNEINKIYEHNCVVVIVNNTNNLYSFRLSWIDHPFLYQTNGKPWHKTGGDLPPKEPFIPTNKQAPGLYTITYWEQWNPNKTDITKNFTITAKNKTIVIALIPDDNKEPIILIFKYDK